MSTLTDPNHRAAPSTCPGSALATRSDQQLLTLLRCGSDRAFEALATRYQPRLQRFCWSMLGSNENAEDAVQDVFVTALRALRADDRAVQVRPWLYQVARNRCINELRRARKIRFETLDDEHAHDAPTLSETLSSRQRVRDLIGDVQALPDKQGAALLLREFDGYAYKQIATAMDTSVPGVKSLLVRARIGLRASCAAREASIA